MEPTIPEKKSRIFAPLPWALTCGLVPFVLQSIYVMNAFYHYGAPYFDAGLFANLLWHNDAWLTTPHCYGTDKTYLAVHFSPLLVAVGALSHIIPLGMVEYYSLFMGLVYASLAVAMGYMLLVCAPPKRYYQLALLLVIAVAYSFNGIVMQGIWMPHFEYMIPAFILLFLLHLKLENRSWALFFFCFTLCLREDAGFHLSAILLLLMTLRLWRTHSFKGMKTDALYTLAACGYSLFAWFMVGHFHGAEGADQPSVFREIYMGDPPYAHLTFALLAQRAHVIFREAPYLWTGFLLSAIWAWRKKNLFWLIGFAAYIPWFVFNWTAFNPNTGTLYAYYAFPFLVSMGWPFISILSQYGKNPPSGAVWDALKLQAALAIAGLVVWNLYDEHLDFGPTWWSSRWGSYSVKWEGTERNPDADTRPFIHELVNDISQPSALGATMVDAGMMALSMGSITENRGLNLAYWKEDKPVDSLIYFCLGVTEPEFAEEATKRNLAAHYQFLYGTLCLFTNRTPDQMGSMMHWFTPIP